MGPALVPALHLKAVRPAPEPVGATDLGQSMDDLYLGTETESEHAGFFTSALKTQSLPARCTKENADDAPFLVQTLIFSITVRTPCAIPHCARFTILVRAHDVVAS